MKTNNKGFSYVEMVVVIGIMALMVGMITISFLRLSLLRSSFWKPNLVDISDKHRKHIKGISKRLHNTAISIRYLHFVNYRMRHFIRRSALPIPESHINLIEIS